MIPSSSLSNVKTIVVHDKCADGIASAIILHDALPEAKIELYNYGNEILCQENMLFCDIIPPQERTEEFVKAGTIVLDHHAKVKKFVEQYELHAFADEKTQPGVSGAMLAFQEVWKVMAAEKKHKHGAIVLDPPIDDEIFEFAKLAGIRDTWQNKDPLWIDACVQAEVLEFYPIDYFIPEFFVPFSPLTEEELIVGDVLYQKKMNYAQNVAKECFKRVIGKYKVAIFQATDSSDIAEELRKNHGVNIAIAFNYYFKNEKWHIGYSCRSDETFDIGKMAQHFGGGGHSKAAGFRQAIDYETKNPFSFTIDLIKDYLITNE